MNRHEAITQADAAGIIPRTEPDGWTTSPRTYALIAAQHLADALDALNRSGVTTLDHQRDGAAYGEATKALRITLAALYGPELADRIRHCALDTDRTIAAAAVIAAEDDVIDAADALDDAVTDYEAIAAAALEQQNAGAGGTIDATAMLALIPRRIAYRNAMQRLDAAQADRLDVEPGR